MRLSAARLVGAAAAVEAAGVDTPPREALGGTTVGDVGLATGGGCSGLPMPFPLGVPPSSEHAGESQRARLGGVVDEGVCVVSACDGADAVVVVVGAVVGAVVAVTVASEPGDVGASAVGA